MLSVKNLCKEVFSLSLSMKVKVAYSIVAIELAPPSDKVFVSLRKAQEEQVPKATTVVPMAASEEERMGQKMVMGAMEGLKQLMPPSPWVIPKLDLSWTEYEKLGKPTVNDILLITFEVAGQKED